jgi:hypothetical protein
MSASGHALPTRLTLRDLRSDSLHRLLVSPRGQVSTVDEISGLADLGSWRRPHLEAAIADLVDQGLLDEDAHGQLIVRSRPA